MKEVVQQTIKDMRTPVKPGKGSEEWPPCPAFIKWLEADRPHFPLQVFPALVRQYIKSCAHSIHCPTDLLAVPLLAVAGAAIGRSDRRLKVKDGWVVSSCLWTACLTASGGGKTPALNAVENFYDDRQEVMHHRYLEALQAHEVDKNNPKPAHYPSLKLTDTTLESLRTDLAAGPVLFSRDELGAWCHQMGQYKKGNADRFDWCSFWSHSQINIGRKTERVHVKAPFVAVTGMMVPASARELNYRGQADDGFVHRLLLASPYEMPPMVTREGVPDELTANYKEHMALLFEPPVDDKRVLTIDEMARDMLDGWANNELFAELISAPPWLHSKYRKLHENCLRLCLVLHELWRVAGKDDEPEGSAPHPRRFYGQKIPFDDGVVDILTVQRAITVIEYFRDHIHAVQTHLGEEVDDVDRLYTRLRRKGTITVREVTRQSTYKSKEQVLTLFTEWASRGYGEVQHPRANQVVFAFAKD